MEGLNEEKPRCEVWQCGEDGDFEYLEEGQVHRRCIMHAPYERKKSDYERFERLFKEKLAFFLKEYFAAPGSLRENIVLNCSSYGFKTLRTADLIPNTDYPGINPDDRIIPFKILFTGARFYKEISLYEVKFLQHIEFSNTTIGSINKGKEGLRLRENKQYTFDVYAVFGGCHFYGGVSFNGATFHIYASFNQVAFLTRTEFRSSQFLEIVNFDGCRFMGDIWFNDAYFGRETYFRSVLFYNQADFIWAHFPADTEFKDTEIREGIDFEQVEVNRAIKFYLVKYFNRTRSGSLEYVNRKPTVKDAYARVDFTNVDIKPGARVYLGGSYLNDWAFGGTPSLNDPEVFDFTGAKWKPTKPGITKGRNKVYDEDRPNKDRAGVDYVAEIYRRLRKNYEDRLAYEEASDFHVGQMLMLLKNPDTGWLKKVFLGAYWAVSNFGESIGRPLLWFTGLWAFFAWVWILKGFPYRPGINTEWNIALPWLVQIASRPFDFLIFSKDAAHAILYAFKTFLTLPSTSEPIPTQTLGAVQRLLGVSVITLFILALRRAFRR